jgi:hypothetical protein
MIIPGDAGAKAFPEARPDFPPNALLQEQKISTLGRLKYFYCGYNVLQPFQG